MIPLPHVLGIAHREKPVIALAGPGELVNPWLHHQFACTNCYKKKKMRLL